MNIITLGHVAIIDIICIEQHIKLGNGITARSDLVPSVGSNSGIFKDEEALSIEDEL